MTSENSDSENRAPNNAVSAYRSVEWRGDHLRLLDQRCLPEATRYIDYFGVDEVATAIRDMVVRGAPAIGATAAYGLVLEAQLRQREPWPAAARALAKAADTLRAARPTAVNLFWATERVMSRVAHTPPDATTGGSGADLLAVVLKEAQRIEQLDVATNRTLSQYGQTLVPDQAVIIHHCNTGSLATVDYGTALGVIRAAHEAGKQLHVLVDETRPRLQGARLTAWELQQLGISHEIIVDGAAAHFMRTRRVDLCVVGCDRVAANGDVANKIGTYHLAIAAKAHKIPFYVAAPTSTLDPATPHGDNIDIEFRDPEEITRIGDTRIAPPGASACNPAFDITPARYITALITEKGILRPPFRASIKRCLAPATQPGPTIHD